MTGFYAIGEVATGSMADAGATVPGDDTAPVLSLAAAAATGSTTAMGAVTTDEANGTLFFLAATATPTVAAIKAGGSQPISSAGAKNISVSGLTPNTTYQIYFLHRDATGNDSGVLSTASFVTQAAGDTTAPTLTAASATATSQMTATGAVTTNEAGGTLYWLANTSATATAAQVKAGSSKAVTAAGAQSVSVTGLAAGATLYLHFLHADGAATPNESAVANTASFTTQSAGGTTGPVMQGELIASKTSTTTTITVPVATDASGIGEYFFAIDGGAPVSNGTSRTKTYTGLAPLTAHLYEATASDTLGNLSSNSLSITVVTDAAGDDPSLVQKNIVVTLKARNLDLQANAAGINWQWSDERGTVTSFGGGLVASSAGVLSIPIRTRLLADGVGMLTLDNYNGGNALTYFGYTGPVRVP